MLAEPESAGSVGDGRSDEGVKPTHKDNDDDGWRFEVEFPQLVGEGFVVGIQRVGKNAADQEGIEDQETPSDEEGFEKPLAAKHRYEWIHQCDEQ